MIVSGFVEIMQCLLCLGTGEASDILNNSLGALIGTMSIFSFTEWCEDNKKGLIREESDVVVKTSDRNISIDFFRGIAMLMVVLQHTISGCAKDCENSMLLNILWTVQMPLFIIISGYVTRYSRRIADIKSLGQLIIRRSSAYLIPWFSWTFVVRGIVLNQNNFFDIKYLLWHMDTGYWFLVTIWTISLIFGVAQFLTTWINKTGKLILDVLWTTIFIFLEMGILLAVGMVAGLSFFGIKLTLYYIPFFCIGYWFSILQREREDKVWFNSGCTITVALCALVYVALLVRKNFYAAGDSPLEIVLRVTASITGCTTVFGLVGKSLPKNIGGGIRWIGVHSLEIYLTHYLFLALLVAEKTQLMSIEGLMVLLMNYTLTMLLSILATLIIQKNPILDRLLFWRRHHVV